MGAFWAAFLPQLKRQQLPLSTLYSLGADLPGSKMARFTQTDLESVVTTSIVLLLIGFSVGIPGQ